LIGGLGEHVFSLLIGVFLITFGVKPQWFSKKNAEGHKKMMRVYLLFGVAIILLNLVLIFKTLL